MNEAQSKRAQFATAGLTRDARTDQVDEALLELTEAIVFAHQAAARDGDRMALALLEPLLRHAGDRLLAAYAKATADDLNDRLCDGGAARTSKPN